MPSTRGSGLVLDEVRVDGLRIIEVTHAPGVSLGPHTHEEAKLSIILGGGMTERHGLHVESQRALDVLVRPERLAHANQYHEVGAHELLVEVDPDDKRVRRTFTAFARGPHVVRSLKKTTLMLAVAFRQSPHSARSRQVLAAVLRLFAALQTRPPPDLPVWLETARAFLVERIADPPPLLELARLVGVHPVHLAQTFRARLGMSTREVIRATRVFRAVELIDRGVGLAHVAAEVGFADQSHMTRTFRQVRNVTPGALGRRSRSNGRLP